MYLNIEDKSIYRAGLYVRLSKEDDNLNESESIVNQKSMLDNFAKKHNLSVYKIYIDDGFSGGNYDRPAFMQMIKDIEENKINMVITKDMSRLGRDYIQTGYYLERYFPENNIRYISILDNIDTGVESALNDITPFKAIMNDLYAKDISKKIKSVKQDKVKSGKFIGSKAPYGYKKCKIDKNKIVIDEYAAEIVKRIFNMALSGISGRAIALKLTEDGIDPPSVYANIKLSKQTAYSSCWKSEVISNMLKNEVYIGNMVQGRVKKVNYKSKKCIRIPKEEWVIVKNTHQPIIEKEVYDKIQILLNKRSNIKTKSIEYSLKGLIYCKDCNKAMGIVPKKDKYYLRCRTYAKFTKLRKCTSHSIRADLVERVVIDELAHIINYYGLNKELLEIALNIINKRPENSRAAIDELKIKLDYLNKDIDKIYMDKVSGVIDEEDFIRIYNNIKSEKSKLLKNIENLENNFKYKSSINLVQYASLLLEDFININKYRKLICTELVEKIEIGDNKEIYIYLKV